LGQGTLLITDCTVQDDSAQGGSGGAGGVAGPGGTGGNGGPGGRGGVGGAGVSPGRGGNGGNGGSGGVGGNGGADGSGGNGGSGYGGGIYVSSGGTLQLINSTVAVNSVSPGKGGPEAIAAAGGGLPGQGGAGGTGALGGRSLNGAAGPSGAVGSQGAAGADGAFGSFGAAGAAGFVDGGGLYLSQATVTLTNDTIALNTSPGDTAGGVFQTGSTVVANNSLFAENSTVDFAGSLDANYSLFQTVPAGTITGSHNLTSVADPGLDSAGLQNNGGPTETIALESGSPAIDAGSNALAVDSQGNPLPNDQRGAGYPRIVNGVVDIGAFERGGLVEAATGGTAISADTTGTSFTTLTGLGYDGVGIPTGTIILNAPAGFVFNTSSANAPNLQITHVSGTGADAVGTITAVSASQITVTITGAAGAGVEDLLSWQNVEVEPAAGTPLASGDIYETGTSALVDVVQGSGGSNWGTLTEIPGTATQLVILTQPSATATAGAPFAVQPVVADEDQFGNIETGDSTSTITAARGSEGTSTLQGANLTVTVKGGIATFSGLSYDKAETMNIVFISAPSLGAVTSSSIAVAPAAATKLAFVQQPTNTVYGDAIGPAVTIEFLDPYDNVTTSDEVVGLTLSGGSSGAALNGTTSTTNAEGDVEFASLTISKVGTSYVLNASATGLTSVSSSTFDITARPITVAASDNTKTYDGTTSAAAVPTIVAGSLAAGDTASFTEVYSTSNAGTGLALVPSGTVDDGNGGANYAVTFQNDDNGVINPATLTAAIIGSPTKTYNGTTVATLTAANFSLTGLVGSNSFTVTQTSGTFNSKDVTTATSVTASLTASEFTPGSGTLASNYALPSTASGAGSITPATVTASIVGDPTKAYDGTSTATLSPTSFSLSPLFGSDSFTVTQTSGAYNSANVTAASTVMASLSASDFTPGSGTLASDYTLPTTATGAGTITPALLAVSIIGDPTKVYDGTTAATLTATSFTISGTVGSNSFTLTPTTSGTYNTKDVSTATTVTASLSASDFTPATGTLASNYTLPSTASGPGTITPATLTASIVGDPTKTYDGTSTATLTSANFKLSGLFGSDSFTVTQTSGTYNSPNVATATTLTTTLAASNFAPVGGSLASDYALPSSASGPGAITPAPLTITAGSATVQIGAPLPALPVAYSGFVDGQTAANLITPPVIHDAATSTTTPGVYTVTASGASASNYQITYVPGTLTVVLPPATVDSVMLEKIKVSKHKKVEGIVIQFSEALDGATAQTISSYSLATVPKTKKQKPKAVALSKATYNSTAFTVTLLAKKTLVVNPPLTFTIKASNLLDALGRELDGNDSGQAGSNYTAVLSKKGVQVTSARELARPAASSSARAVDAVLAGGLHAHSHN
jgi:MBG domain (YGX type)/YDG domain